VPVWAESFHDNETRELYVEIRQDGMVAHATKKVKGSKTMSWNEEFLMYVWLPTSGQSVDETSFNSIGNNSSTISLSLMHERSCLYSIDFVLGTLLTACLDNKCMLEMYNLICGVSWTFRSCCSPNDVDGS
jgi:hypothetical protein